MNAVYQGKLVKSPLSKSVYKVIDCDNEYVTIRLLGSDSGDLEFPISVFVTRYAHVRI